MKCHTGYISCIPNCHQRNYPEINKAARLPKAKKLLAEICISKNSFNFHARFIPRWKYRFSSDQRSQATLGTVSTSDLFLRVLATSRLFRVLFPNRVRFNKVYFHRGQNRYPQRVSQPEGVHFLHFASKGVASQCTPSC